MQNANNIMNEIRKFSQGLNGDPKQIVMDMVNTGKISQQDLNKAQQEASQIMKMLGKQV